ncbi:MAG: hypothetical protein IKQ33_04825 [Clostridia bacterium]|nr:hypothetical protein [Clostridia bacterium]
MLPEIIRERDTVITIAMPLPDLIPKNWKDVKEWQSSYQSEKNAKNIFEELEQFNVDIIDVRISWEDFEYHFIMNLHSKEDLARLKKAISQYLN